MECPKCQGMMARVSFKDIEVDRCERCGGLWFDMLEHEQLQGIPGAEVLDNGSPDFSAAHNQLMKVNCPKCHTQMTRMVAAHQSHIWYEKCSACYGVYFDAGEFRDYHELSFSDFLKSLFSGERS